ncbi:MAG: 2-amino-4-hydroxy-6-hydroxymethyldihydropteridine diphosphokinase [Chlorobi bacterium]|nr:2-amino-4-hydroxy-6-hydroxymethyldihydropteridine diphosphokinase [Chlorobiota bacterium]
MARTSPTISEKVLLALGSNLGNRLGYLCAAATLLDTEGIISDAACSSVYETVPVGYHQQPMFLNCCIAGATQLDPFELQRRLKDVEMHLGRQLRPRWHEREIDIDIVLYGTHIIATETLIIPHPGATERAFVLLPASEIVPNWIHPVTGCTVAELALRVATDGVTKTDFCIAHRST